MDGFFEKFSIYDFFNLIATGIAFLCGFIVLEPLEFTALTRFLHEYPEMQWILFVIILGGCYLVGSILQQISGFIFEKKYSSSVTSTILCNHRSVLNNQIKLEVHQKYAKKLFQKKGIPFLEGCFTTLHSEYYFAYCSYYIQNQNKHNKSEKMRGLRGLYSMFVTCFSLLLIIAISKIGFAVINADPIFPLAGIACIYLFLMLVYCRAYKENTKYWIRMVLGIYEACVDIDMQDMKNK